MIISYRQNIQYIPTHIDTVTLQLYKFNVRYVNMLFCMHLDIIFRQQPIIIEFTAPVVFSSRNRWRSIRKNLITRSECPFKKRRNEFVDIGHFQQIPKKKKKVVSRLDLRFFFLYFPESCAVRRKFYISKSQEDLYTFRIAGAVHPRYVVRFLPDSKRSFPGGDGGGRGESGGGEEDEGKQQEVVGPRKKERRV